MRTAPRTPRHHAPGTRKGWLGWFARIREFDDWRQVSTLRAVVPVILAAVSAYYLTRWAEANAMPWALAWTLPAALDVTAFMAVTVARRAAGGQNRCDAPALREGAGSVPIITFPALAFAQWLRDQPEDACLACRIGAFAHPELVVDTLQVPFHRPLGETEGLANLTIRHPGCGDPQNFELTSAQ